MSTFGFGFAIANDLIGISYIKNLNEMTLVEVKAHKINGRTAGLIFYFLSALCIITAVIPRFLDNKVDEFFITTIFWHTGFGGFIAFVLFSIKIYIAVFKKDLIYAKGKIIGPIGFIAWAIAYFTSNIDFYFYVAPTFSMPVPFLIPNYLISLIISVCLGGMLFASIKATKFKKYGTADAKSSLHGVAMILHGITFGYEGSAKELVGTPVLYKYVFPKTYQFLERYAEKIGLNLEQLKKLNLNEAMDKAMEKFVEIGMAEKIKIEWLSDREFTVESINCSTAVVRSYMDRNELTNSICPWAILAATIVNSLTGKDLEINPSEFNTIGAKSQLRLMD
ncbi:MAG: hypothetical protein JW891_14230 [Candidatus Lokiarchaeota archaeon]|nr:hypothetical protein [Candidatus Lokiarchaeota archaeon]